MKFSYFPKLINNEKGFNTTEGYLNMTELIYFHHINVECSVTIYTTIYYI